MNANEKAGVVIVGAGLNGAATAFFLAERGITDVLVLERDYPGAGASSRGMGLIRTYHANEPEAVLALKSLRIFADWESRIGGSAGFRRTGFLWLDHVSRRERLLGHVAMLRRLGSDSRLIEADELARLQPHLDVADTVAVHEPDCGTGYGARANESLLAGAVARGVRLRTGVGVLGLIRANGRAIGVTTTAGAVHAGAVVLAAGAWSAPIAASIGIALPVVCRRLTVGRALLSAEIHAPMTFLDGHFDASFRPEDGPTALISMRDGRYGEPIDPDRRIEDVDPAARGLGIKRLRQRIPSATRFVPLNTWTGVDGFTPDYKGIYGEHHECPGLFIVAGASEKGFKVSPAVGMGMAELIATGHSPDIVRPEFSPARFSGAAAPGSAGQIDVRELI
jgi:sarcosine oxidase subunit beta